MVGHHKNGLLAQSQPLALHGGGNHFKGLARAHFVGKQCITAIENMGNGVSLMLPEGDFRVHARKDDVTAVIFPWAGAVHFLIVLPNQCLTAFRVCPDPVLERIPDELLLLCRQRGFLGIQHPLFVSVRILNGVVHLDIPEVQGIFQNFIGADTIGAIGVPSGNIVVGNPGFVTDAPCGGIRGILHIHGIAQIAGGIEGFKHELLDVGLVDPGCAKTHLNLGSIQILGLCSTQGFHIDLIGRILCRSRFRLPELLPDIAGQILVSRYPAHAVLCIAEGRVVENHAPQLRCQFLRCLAGQAGHIFHVHLCLFRNGEGEGFTGSIHGGDNPVGLDGAFGEHIRLALEIAVIVHNFQSA